jgi:hypothetical protein
MAQVDEVVVESPNLEVAMAVVEKLASEAARASTTQDTALVVVLAPLPISSHVGHASSSQRLEDDVVLEFDATHHLSMLTVAWENLSAGAASFGEQLQVGIFFFLVFSILASFTFFLIFFLFRWEKSFSRDHSSFFGLGETNKKLAFELSQLKAELASKEVELDSERQGR